MGKKHGKGQESNIWSKETMIGQWINDKKEGDFEILYEGKTKRITKYRDDKEVQK